MTEAEKDAMYDIACPYHDAKRGLPCGRTETGPYVCTVRITASRRRAVTSVFGS